MSRPPRPLFRTRTTGEGAAFDVTRQFLPVEFAEMVREQWDLAEEDASLGVTKEDGDFAYTLMELSALLGHTLGLYQNLYARNAYLGTAENPKSLVLHARRLAFEPDAGLAASGYAALTVGKGLIGKLPEGFALASSPRGEVKAQTFETLEELEVDSARNQALPVARTRPATLVFAAGLASLRLDGTGLTLAEGPYGILIRSSDGLTLAVSIVSLAEDEENDVTLAGVELLDPASAYADTTFDLFTAVGAPAFRFLAMPKDQLRRFGFDADPVQFPPVQVATAAAYAPPASPVAGTTYYGYTVTLESGGGHRSTDVYLSATIKDNLLSQPVLARVLGVVQAVTVTEQGSASVAFRRGRLLEYQVGIINNSGNAVMQDASTFQESQVAAAATYLCLNDATGAPLERSDVALQGSIYSGWQFEAEVPATEPNPAAVSAPLEVDVDFGEFRPGRFVAFEKLDGSFSQVVSITSLEITADGTTNLEWEELTDPPSLPWTLDNIRIYGNVAQVTHGESSEEVLGGSDGVTPFLRFELKKSPLTQVPTPNGGDPAIEVRVNEVAWTRVDDFFESGPEDRQYRVEIDEDQKASVVFGNGINGAIPPSGKKHIRAVYRKGLGVDGNVDAGAASRIKKAHPLIEKAFNPTWISGGTDPSGLSDLRNQATRYIRTFDRAVSVEDHADVALLYPGVARASARWTNDGGIEVVAATAEGVLPAAQSQVEQFLNARRDSTLPMQVVGPEAVPFYLSLEIEHDPDYLTENIKLAVQEALLGDDTDSPGMFTFAARDFGQAAHLSEVYECVAAVEGVTFVDVTRFRIDNDAGVKDVLEVSPRQWLSLPPSNLSLSATPEQAT